jgi:putative ABC transport system permease protein
MLSRITAGVKRLLRPGRFEQELDAEMQSFLEAAIERKMRDGLSEEAATRAARMELGSPEAVKDRVRDVGWESAVDSLYRDAQYAIRSLRRTPGFTAVALLTISLGIGANTAIFSVANSLLLRALPVAEPERLVTLSSADDVAERRAAKWSYAAWRAIQQRSNAFAGACAWSALPLNLAQRGESQPVTALFASGDCFSTWGVSATVGRALTVGDDLRPDGAAEPVVLISHGYWQRQFGGAATAIGTHLAIDGVPFTIAGVTPAAFFGPEVGTRFDVVLPIGTEPLINRRNSVLGQPGAFWLTIMLRLKASQSIDHAAATLRGLQRQIADAAIPEGAPPQFSRAEFVRNQFVLVPGAAGTSTLREEYQRSILAILAVAAVVLVIACLNLANLLLARATTRRHEYSVRIALGAPRSRLVRLLLIESLLLAGIGSAAGLLLALWGSRVLVTQLSTYANRIFLDLSLDWRVMAFTVASALLATVLFGAGPAFHAGIIEPIDALKTPVSANSRKAPWSPLAIAQMALALMLVIVAGLFVRTFERLATLPLGFDSERILVVNLDATGLPPETRLDLYSRLANAVKDVPTVASTAVSMLTPVRGGMRDIIGLSGTPELSELERTVQINYLTHGWFATYGTAIRAGRALNEHDDVPGAPRALVVNESFARRFFPQGDAVGQAVVSGQGRSRSSKMIVGVAADSVYGSLRDEIEPTIYAPLSHMINTPGVTRLSIRAAGGEPTALVPAARAALTSVEPNLKFSFLPLREQVSASFARERLVAVLAGVFGALALLLASVGLYGLSANTAGQRRREIGIRMTLGAQRGAIVRMVIGDSIATTVAGVALGVAGAMAISRYLEGLLFGITPLDVMTFVAVSVIFAVAVVIAALMPARRATRVDPLTVLRYE